MDDSGFQTGDRVRAFDTWSNKSQGKGTVATTSQTGCGVELDKAKGAVAHFYNSELAKVIEHR